MVRLVMPENVSSPAESNVEKKKASLLRQILAYLFYLLFLGLVIAGLWYAQVSGYIDFHQLTKTL